MINIFSAALLGLTAALAGCQPAPTTGAPGASAGVAPAATAATEPEARAAVARYIQTLPNAALYVPDSASAVEVEARWQVLVPRTDWARRMPNRAAFEVDKATGTVITRPVK